MVTVAIEQDSVLKSAACTSETSCATLLNAVELTSRKANVNVASKGNRTKCDDKRVTAKQSCRQEKKPREIKPLRRSTSRTKRQHRNVHYNTAMNVRGSLTLSSGKTADRSAPTKCDRDEAGSKKPTQLKTNAKEGDRQTPNMDFGATALPTYTADGSNGCEEQGVVVYREDDDGFETVKSRRALMLEKKRLRERIMATMADASVLGETTLLKENANVQREKAHKNMDMAVKASKVAPAQSALSPHEKAANSRQRNIDKVIKDRNLKHSKETTTRTRGQKKEKKPAKTKVCIGTSDIKSPEQVALVSRKQVIEEVSMEVLYSKKSTKATEASMKRRKTKRQSDQVRDDFDSDRE
ncbi:unnamed protein product [Peronospora belbahrii]|uniref:Shugoshin C-terminal domain-containing protein n=1 Tax=Peronospora belbahrii TaxID=622444 RepID=A0ABN8D207_9STRA|nr:unnamed protein product [Peronospora belbahrii]